MTDLGAAAGMNKGNPKLILRKQILWCSVGYPMDYKSYLCMGYLQKTKPLRQTPWLANQLNRESGNGDGKQPS